MNRFRYLLTNDYIFMIFSRGMNVCIGVLYMILFNRFFGVELKGESAIILNYIAILSTIFDCGITQSYAYFRNRKNMAREKYFANSVICFFIMLILSIFIGALIGKILWITILTILPIRVFSNRINTMISIENPIKRGRLLIIQNLVDLMMVAILFLFFSPYYYLLVFFLIVKEIIALIIIVLKSNVKFKLIYLDYEYFSSSIRYGIFSMICILLMEINYRVDILMLENNVSTAMIGLYSLGVSLSERVWLIPDALKETLISKLSKGTNYMEVAKACRIGVFSCLLLTLFVIFTGKFWITILFGHQYTDAYSVTIILLVGVIGMVFYKMIYAYFLVKGKQKINVIILCVTGASNIVTNYLLIPIMGISGAALASVISYSLCGMAFIMCFVYETKIDLKDVVVIKYSDIRKFISMIKK